MAVKGLKPETVSLLFRQSNYTITVNHIIIPCDQICGYNQDKKPIILCMHSTSSSSEQSMNSENLSKICLFYSKNNKKMYDYSTWATQFFEKFRAPRVQRFAGFFFLIVLFGCRLAEQTSSGHMALNKVLLHKALGPFTLQKMFGTALIKMVHIPIKMVRLGYILQCRLCRT